MNQNNGNKQVNEIKDNSNEMVRKYSILGKSKSVQWKKRRRYASI